MTSHAATHTHARTRTHTHTHTHTHVRTRKLSNFPTRTFFLCRYGYYSPRWRVRLMELGYCTSSNMVSDCHHVMLSLLLKSVRNAAGCLRYGSLASQMSHDLVAPVTPVCRQYSWEPLRPQVLVASTGRLKAAFTKGGMHLRGRPPGPAHCDEILCAPTPPNTTNTSVLIHNIIVQLLVRKTVSILA